MYAKYPVRVRNDFHRGKYPCVNEKNAPSDLRTQIFEAQFLWKQHFFALGPSPPISQLNQKRNPQLLLRAFHRENLSF